MASLGNIQRLKASVSCSGSNILALQAASTSPRHLKYATKGLVSKLVGGFGLLGLGQGRNAGRVAWGRRPKLSSFTLVFVSTEPDHIHGR